MYKRHRGGHAPKNTDMSFALFQDSVFFLLNKKILVAGNVNMYSRGNVNMYFVCDWIKVS